MISTSVSNIFIITLVIAFITFCCHAQEAELNIDQDDDPMVNIEAVTSRGPGRGRSQGHPLEEGGESRAWLRKERKRMKEERRQDRWERREERRRQRLDGRKEEGEPEGSLDDSDRGRPRHQQQAPNRPQEMSNRPRTPETSPTRTHTSQATTEVPVIVDIEWLRANLSELWSVVGLLYKRQSRPYLHRGTIARGRGHSAGVQDPSAGCPVEDDACRGEGDQLCGGHGQCSCGQCICQPSFYGTYCQCSDHTCPLYDGMSCGGPTRGQCRCGGCVCRPGYTGDACDCPTDNQGCISPGEDVICSGKGTCECGRCKCGDGYKGMYCKDNVYAAGVCEKLKPCVLCRAWKRELPTCAQCQITVTIVDNLEPSMTKCVMVNSGCLLQYSYIPQGPDAYTVLVPRHTTCPSWNNED